MKYIKAVITNAWVAARVLGKEIYHLANFSRYNVAFVLGFSQTIEYKIVFTKYEKKKKCGLVNNLNQTNTLNSSHLT